MNQSNLQDILIATFGILFALFGILLLVYLTTRTPNLEVSDTTNDASSTKDDKIN